MLLLVFRICFLLISLSDIIIKLFCKWEWEVINYLLGLNFKFISLNAEISPPLNFYPAHATHLNTRNLLQITYLTEWTHILSLGENKNIELKTIQDILKETTNQQRIIHSREKQNLAPKMAQKTQSTLTYYGP
jgi:hypothetical protein